MGVRASEIDELSFNFHPTLMVIKKGHRILATIAGHDEKKARIPVEGTLVIMVSRNK